MTEMRHAVTRIRRERQRRAITVAEKTLLSPSMLRIRFESPELVGFDSAAPDDHVKLFLDTPEQAENGRPAMRDYTPRSFDAAAGVLVIDFALHEAGPATRWAVEASVGDRIQIGSPQGSTVIADDFDWYLLIGDETALPAIARRVEELRPGVTALVVAVIDGPDDRIAIAGAAAVAVTWVTRAGATIPDEALLQRALQEIALPQGEGYIWIAAEAAVARAIRHYVVEERHHPRVWTKASGYWTRGHADRHERIDD